METSSDLKLKGISSDKSQISSVYYSTKPETSTPFSKTANEDEEDTVSVTPSDLDSPIETPPVYQNQLRVLTFLNDDFEIDWDSLYNEFMLASNKTKRKYFQDNFAQLDKDRVKRKWLEMMNQLKKHILFFDFLENHYVPNNEVSKQHLYVIKKSNFVKIDKTIVRSSHPPLDSILITTKKDEVTKEEVKASPFKIADDQTPIVSLIEQRGKGTHC